MSTFISAKTVTTRKPHKCWGCTELFPKGTVMVVSTSADGGSISSVYWCSICASIQQDTYEPGDSYGFGEFRQAKAEFLLKETP